MRDLFALQKQEENSIFQECIRLDKENKDILYKLYLLMLKLESFKRLELACCDVARTLLPKKQLIASTCGILFGLPNDTRLAYDWHQESNYTDTLGGVMNCHFPVFEKASKKNGTMSVLAGSHNKRRPPCVLSAESDDSYRNLIPKGIDKLEQKYPEKEFILNLGDIAIFHHDLVHKSNHNYSNRTRFSGVIRVRNLDKLPAHVDFSMGIIPN